VLPCCLHAVGKQARKGSSWKVFVGFGAASSRYISGNTYLELYPILNLARESTAPADVASGSLSAKGKVVHVHAMKGSGGIAHVILN
jgi:hypothetical protein